MSNPDSSKLNVDSFAISVPIAIFFLAVTIILFIFQSSILYFKAVLWIGIPILTYIVSSCVNMITQYISCTKINAGKAFLGGLPSVATVFLSIGLASISYYRIPVASVFAPFVIGQDVDITKKKMSINSLKNNSFKECCSPKMTLENIEIKYPIVAGIAYGFYVMFGILFGLTFGSGIAAIC